MRAAWVPKAAALKSAALRVKREAGETPALPPQRYAAGLPSATEVTTNLGKAANCIASHTRAIPASPETGPGISPPEWRKPTPGLRGRMA